MKSIQQIHDQAESIQLSDALFELIREEEVRVGTMRKPGGTYNRWANAKPADLSKHRAYENQTARLVAARLVLSTLSPEEFHRRLFAITNAQPKMFQ